MIRLLPVLLLFWANGLAAQTATLRSGDHPGFTRLVLTQPSPAAWDFGRSETGYVIRLRERIGAFDTSTVFDRISRARLSALSARPEEGLLALNLNCVCHAIATPFRPGVIIIDIADGPAPAGSPFEEMLPLPGLPQGWTRPMTELRPMRRPAAAQVDTPKVPAPGPRRLPERTALPSVAKRMAVPDARAELLSESLSRALSRAIASGAIAASQPLPRHPPSRPQVLPLPAPDPTPTPTIAEQMSMRPAGDPPSREPPASGTACTEPSQLALAEWGDARPAWVQIAEKRRTILEEFDRPSLDAIRDLSRLYLHFGFGAEAEQMTSSWPLSDAESHLLRSLANLVDGTTPRRHFTGMAACDGPAALWSVLEAERLPPETDRAAVLRSFSELPPWLRRELGPRLAQRFLAAGDLPTAQSLEQMITRSVPEQAPEAALIGGQIDLASGKPEAGLQKLDQVARSNTDLAPIALAALLDTKLARGDPISEEDINALEALTKAHKDGAEAPKLRRTLARSLIAAGMVDRAFGTIAPREPELYPDLWELLAQRGSDFDLSKQLLSPVPGALRDLPAATRLKLADRLTSAGFPAQAISVLEPMTGADADLGRAQAHLKLRDGRAALRSLAGAAGPSAATLRAEALELLAEWEEAQRAWLEAGNEERAQRLNLLRLDLSALPASTRMEVTALANSLTKSPDHPDEPLAKARSQITEALNLRATAASLLTMPAAP